MRIPIIDLSTEIETLLPSLNEAFQTILKSGSFIGGAYGQKFEKNVAEFLGVKHAVNLNSGTDALVIGLRSLKIGPGDEVICPSFTFFATAEAISLVGATPVFAEIEADTFNIDVMALQKLVTKKTKAILPVHLFGQTARMDVVMDFAKSNGLAVLEDVAQAFGADFKGKKLGGFGAMGAFSFYPTKNLGAYGDAGMIVTNDDALAENARSLRNHGSLKRYYNTQLGYNSRMDEFQAAVLGLKLSRVAKGNELRRQAANRYDEAFRGHKEIVTPVQSDFGNHVFHQYTVRIKNGRREAVQKALADKGIGTMIYYPVPVHRLEVYKNETANLPATDLAAEEVLSLPIWPEISAAIQGEVSTELRNALHG